MPYADWSAQSSASRRSLSNSSVHVDMTDIRAAAAILTPMSSHYMGSPSYSLPLQMNVDDDEDRPSYYERNRDQVRENQRLYRESNRDKIRAIHKAYYLKNRAKITAYKRERWHQKKSRTPGKEHRSRSEDSSSSFNDAVPSRPCSSSTTPSAFPRSSARMPLHMLLNPVPSDE
ncbi:hypothetical protein B5M09_009301 [Aphanomyces astaci]|uniref:Uncharacterized protein n=2 Tax=Aphanomyces astaci TaxID=112090 RepID=A0A3R7Z8E2_APHAT|nr:hypothetical protein B5M09_009301 [Aphanomyces astaci]